MSRASSRGPPGSRGFGDSRASRDGLSVSLGSMSRSASRSGSRGAGSRARSRKAKRIPNSHVPVQFLLGKKGDGYFTEIANFPPVQQPHMSFFGAGEMGRECCVVLLVLILPHNPHSRRSSITPQICSYPIAAATVMGAALERAVTAAWCGRRLWSTGADTSPSLIWR